MDQDHGRLQEIPAKYVTERTPVTQTVRQNTSSCQDGIVPVIHPVDQSVNWSHSVDSHPDEEAVMQISGAGHWFLEGWIGDHAVDFLRTNRRLRDHQSIPPKTSGLLLKSAHAGHQTWIAV